MLLTDELSQTMTSLEVANGRDQPGVKLNLRAVIDFANSSRKENGVTRCY